MNNNLIKSWAFFVLLVTLGGCYSNKHASKFNKNRAKYANKANLYTQKLDSHPNPKDIPDLALVKEPMPKYEPKSRYGNPATYTVLNKTYKVLPSSNGYKQNGYASWYGTKFHGFKTSSGEIYDMYAMTAAHKTLPLPTYARVTNLYNNRSVIVKINDRGPFHEDRIIDLSYAAANKLGILGNGVGKVEVEAINLAANSVDQNLQPPDHANNPKSSGKLQLGAFTVQANAQKLANELKILLKKHYFDRHGKYKVNIIEHDLQKGNKKNILYKVVVSSSDGEIGVKNLMEVLAKIPDKGAFLVN